MIEAVRQDFGYEIGSKKYIGVTTVLASSGLLYVPKETTARDRGSKIHLAIKLFYKGRLDIGEQPEWMWGYLAGFTKFQQEMNFSPEDFEKTLIDDVRGVAGTFDAIGRMPHRRTPVMVDWKTGDVQAATALQLAAYAGMSGKPYERVAVALPGDGTYRCNIFPLTELWRDTCRFRALAEVAKWKDEYR
jgi:hypothetical protein